MAIIENGHGNGNTAKVDEEGQLRTRAQVHTEPRHHSEAGQVFSISSGFLVSGAVADTFNAFMFIKNLSTILNVHIGLIAFNSEVAAKWRMIKNPESMSNPTVITPENMNFSKVAAFDGLCQAGGATSAFTGGVELVPLMSPPTGSFFADLTGSLVLGPEDSLGIEMAPFAAAAGDLSLGVQAWQVEVDT